MLAGQTSVELLLPDAPQPAGAFFMRCDRDGTENPQAKRNAGSAGANPGDTSIAVETILCPVFVGTDRGRELSVNKNLTEESARDSCGLADVRAHGLGTGVASDVAAADRVLSRSDRGSGRSSFLLEALL